MGQDIPLPYLDRSDHNPSVGETHCCEQEEESSGMLRARAHNLLFIHQPPRGGMKNERLKNREMYDERKSEKGAFSKKTELEGRVM